MRQFRTIFNFEFKNYLKNKVFVGTTIFFVVIIAAIMFFPRVMNLFGGGFSAEQTHENTDISDIISTPGENTEIVIGKSGQMAIRIYEGADRDSAKEIFSSYFMQYDVILTDESVEDIKAGVKDGRYECAIDFNQADQFVFYMNNMSIFESKPEYAAEAAKEFALSELLREAGVDEEHKKDILSANVDYTVESLGVNQMDNYFYTYIMIFALYMVILLYGQMVATNVATEKSSRAMELLVTSAKPVAMMFGKVLASCLAGFLQLFAIFGSSILFYNLNRGYWGDNYIISSIFNMPVQLLIYMLIFFVLGFLLYAFMFGAVGSTASKLEDINTSIMPITFTFLAGFLIVITAFSSGTVENSVLLKVCSFIPFTSSMAMFTRIAMSEVPFWESALSIGILALSTVAVGVISARIYRLGVLMYGNPMKIGKIIKLAFEKR